MAVNNRPSAAEEDQWVDIFGEDDENPIDANAPAPSARTAPEKGGAVSEIEKPGGKRRAPKEAALTPAERRQRYRQQRAKAGAKAKDRPEKKGLFGARKPKRGRKGAPDTAKEENVLPADAQPEAGKGKGRGKRRKKKRSLKQSLLRLVLKVAAIVVLLYLLTQVIGGVFVAHDNNMYPAVRDGDLCITYRLGGYYNGDVVGYERDGVVTFGRVVGIPGDVVTIDADTGLKVNGVAPFEVAFYRTAPQDPAVTYPYTVREGEWFVLCDQREDAEDSRSFGGVTKPLGKIVLQLRRRGF